MERIFATVETGIPWKKCRLETIVENNGVTIENWIGLWQKYFSQDPREAFKSLVYIGYGGKIKNAINLFKYKITDSLKASKRKVFNCYILGIHSWVRSIILF